MSNTTVIFIHGFNSNPSDSFKPWLKEELEKQGVIVKMPQMPEADAPKLPIWLKVIDELIRMSDGKIILAGHSLGGTAILRYLEQQPPRPIAAAVLVAAVATNAPGHPPAISNFLKDPWQFDQIRAHCPNLFAIHSQDDTAVPFSDSKLLEASLPLKLTTVNGYGHFSRRENVTKVPELLKLLVEIINSE